jgi:hypothetical protein
MKITICGNGNGKHLMNMLAWIELLGNVGHSASFKVYADGDGNTRWKFKMENEEQQELYDQLRKKLLQEHINTNKDIEYFEI